MGYLVSRDDGWRMPDWLWERVEPLLPAPASHPLGCHNPRVPDRDAMDSILLVLRTGMQWDAQGLLEYDEVVGIDWEWLAADGAMTKAPLGGPKTGPNPTDRAKRGRSARFSRRPQESRSGSRMKAPIATTKSS